MIKKLKRKFIILATASMLVLMTLLVLIMNAVNFTSVASESDTVLEVLSETGSRFGDGQVPPDGKDKFLGESLPHGMSPEVPYESRYFTAAVSENGAIISFDVSRIISVDNEDVENYVNQAYKRKSEKGFIGQFRYLKVFDGEKYKICFLDCGRKLDAFYSFMWTSAAIGLLGCVAVFMVFLFAADKIIRPISESYEKQKQFITNAGHEIKTPLTIIAANVDLLEEDMGENESLDDIRQQSKRLTKLTNELVYLSKMEESEGAVKAIEFPVSDVVAEVAESFSALAEAGETEYETAIQPSVTLSGSPDAISRLTSILIDNAFKYCSEKGKVKVALTAAKRSVVLSVFNTTDEDIPAEVLPHLFERFYRTDASRNSETGGHGIGLSIAAAIVEAHRGKITATVEKGCGFHITAVLPMQ